MRRTHHQRQVRKRHSAIDQQRFTLGTCHQQPPPLLRDGKTPPGLHLQCLPTCESRNLLLHRILSYWFCFLFLCFSDHWIVPPTVNMKMHWRRTTEMYGASPGRDTPWKRKSTEETSKRRKGKKEEQNSEAGRTRNNRREKRKRKKKGTTSALLLSLGFYSQAPTPPPVQRGEMKKEKGKKHLLRNKTLKKVMGIRRRKTLALLHSPTRENCGKKQLFSSKEREREKA